MTATLVLVFTAALVVLAAMWVITGRISLGPSQPAQADRPGLVVRDGDGRITSASLASVHFHTAARGYRMDEVDAVLAAIIDEMRAQESGSVATDVVATSAAVTASDLWTPTMMRDEQRRAAKHVVDLELSTQVAAPASQVWDAVVDWPTQGEWMLLTKVSVSRGDGLSTGSELSAFTGIGRLGFLDTMTITGWNPPYSCDVLHTGRVVRGTGSMRVVAASPDTSVFYWQESLELPWGWLGRVGWTLGGWLFIIGVTRSLAKFARVVAAKSAAA